MKAQISCCGIVPSQKRCCNLALMNRKPIILIIFIVLLLTATACSNPKSLAESHLDLLKSGNFSQANQQYCQPSETLKLHSVKSFQILSSEPKTYDSLPYTEVVAKLDTEQFNFKRVSKKDIPEKERLTQVTLQVWKADNFYQKSLLSIDKLNELIKSYTAPLYFKDAKIAKPSRDTINKNNLCVFLPVEQFDSKLTTTTIPIIHHQANAEQLTGVRIKNLFNIAGFIAFQNDLYLVGNKKVRDPIFNSLKPLPASSLNLNSPLVEKAINESLQFLELWKYDGNLVSMITNDEYQSQPSHLVVVKNKLFFTIEDSEYGNELCKFDGKKVDVIDIQPGILGSRPTALTVANNELYFLAGTLKTGRGLWKYDGTKPTFIAAINSLPPSSPFIEFDHQLYFSAVDAEHGSELWKYDGEKVSLVADINPGKESSEPVYFTVYKNQLMFMTEHGNELWKYDDEKASFVMDIAKGNSEGPSPSVVFKNELYFKAYGEERERTVYHGQQAWKLWKYDGKQTYLATKEIDRPEYLTVYSDRLYLSASGYPEGKLWKFDGKKATKVADDIFSPTNLSVANNALYFIGEDEDTRAILWKLSAK